MFSSKQVAVLLLAISLVSAFNQPPPEWRDGNPAPFGKLNFRDVESIPQDVGNEHWIQDFQPRLYVREDRLGRVSKGARSEKRCHKSLGQIYARSAEVEGNFGIMYSWYFPYDLSGPLAVHTYTPAWQSLIVWFPSKTDLRPYVVRYTGGDHAHWLDDTHWAEHDGHIVFTKKYGELWSDTNKHGGSQPVIAWDRLSPEAKLALNSYFWGYGRIKECRFNDANFMNEMREAHWPPPSGF